MAAMSRPLRPIQDGLIYHVINRGNNRQDVFLKKGDFEAFLKALARRSPNSSSESPLSCMATACSPITFIC